MPVDEQVFAKAKTFDRAALETLLGSLYPAVHRMAAALTGREDVANGVTRFLMKQSLTQVPLWRDADAAERWFYHHTLLTTRRTAKHATDPRTDALADLRGAIDPVYLAFLRALRQLPFQQREAFILHHGEKFALRSLGVAMDCSTKAAEQHLLAAEESLRHLAGDATPAMTAKLATAYAALSPADAFVGPSVKRYVTRTLWPRRIRKVFKTASILAALGFTSYFGYRHRNEIPWYELQSKWEELTSPSTRPATRPTPTGRSPATAPSLNP